MLMEGGSLSRHRGYRSNLFLEVTKAIFSTNERCIVFVYAGLTRAGCDIPNGDTNSSLVRLIWC